MFNLILFLVSLFCFGFNYLYFFFCEEFIIGFCTIFFFYLLYLSLKNIIFYSYCMDCIFMLLLFKLLLSLNKYLCLLIKDIHNFCIFRVNFYVVNVIFKLEMLYISLIRHFSILLRSNLKSNLNIIINYLDSLKLFRLLPIFKFFWFSVRDFLPSYFKKALYYNKFFLIC